MVPVVNSGLYERARVGSALTATTRHNSGQPTMSCVALSVAPKVLTGGCGAHTGSSRRLSNRCAEGQ